MLHNSRSVVAWIALAAVFALGGTYLGGAARAQDFDINAVFWCDPARSGGQTPEQCAATRALVLTNCTACHTFVPIVKAQKSPPEWTSTLAGHKDRLADLADPQIAQIGAYLALRFNPQNPPPVLPPELEALGLQQAN